MLRDVLFQGMAAPLRLEGAGSVLALLPQVIPAWSYSVREADPDTRPFFSISETADSALLRCEWHVDDRPVKSYDPVNAICDAVSAMSFALPAENARLICLHAAAVEMAGRLVVFPNIRRAGKSTLSVGLALAGHPLFSDDVLPLTFSKDNRANGLAMGIAPRLRLPLPDSLPGDFRDRVDAASGPRNRQYAYLRLADQPEHGCVLPVGAFVILDRKEDDIEARLEQVPPDVAMDALLHQNFTRDRHSGDILQAVAATLRDRPVLRLAYARLDDAVACLGAAFRQWPDDPPSDCDGPVRKFRLAQFDGLDRRALGIGVRIRQRHGTTVERIGDTLYLADPDGLGIHRLDALASAIWSVLEDPATRQDILDLLIQAFPGTDPGRVATDLDGLLDMLHGAGLIEPAAIT